jgi:DNA (cytosine-5)-methyltransferase 1
LVTRDVAALTTSELPGVADLAWASFPCQDLSLAGNGAGLRGARSGAFWPFWNLMRGLMHEGRAPRIIALENVCGALTSHGGADFAALCGLFRESGYAFGALVIDAALFLPQSRPRLFLIGARDSILDPGVPLLPWHPRPLVAAATAAQRMPFWWRLPVPPPRTARFEDVADLDAACDPPARTRRLLSMMHPRHRAKVSEAQRARRLVVGALYRRTRSGVQRAEVRFDGLSGCLRTPSGGSSRQTVLLVDGKSVRSRLLTGREAARLMGLPDSYILPENYNEAYHLTGDGVVVPAVRHLAAHLFEPLLA